MGTNCVSFIVQLIRFLAIFEAINVYLGVFFSGILAMTEKIEDTSYYNLYAT